MPPHKNQSLLIANRVILAFDRRPGLIPITGFLLLILVGTVLLSLPVSAAHGRLSWVDALFTATSASCVTGLITVDTASDLSRVGQWIVLAQIQVGGLGIMILSTLFLLMAGRRLRRGGRMVIQDTFTHSGEWSPADVVRQVLAYTLAIEGMGAALLFFRFLPEFGPGEAARQGLFHAVSAFCNAGFSLFSDSLAVYRTDWAINGIICFLIITGGIGFLVMAEVKTHLPWNRRRWARLSLHSRLAISASALLVLLGTSALAGFEWHNTLAEMTGPQKLLAAFFQSVTTRTAGFNTIPIEQMANESLFLVIIMMVIGACPGSCGGGIKTTTLATLLCLGVSKLRGWQKPQIFKRTVSEASVSRALSLTIVSIAVITMATFFLLISELKDIPYMDSRGQFLELLFETVSAFGTVGLSAGITPALSSVGKLIITATMFIGRIGPLVIIMALSRTREAKYYYAEETIMVG
ncbi:MAG: TrkH family potassium uptake protein [Desulfobacterales bacterium]|jgi:trk system potassium uptake protein TrkH